MSSPVLTVGDMLDMLWCVKRKVPFKVKAPDGRELQIAGVTVELNDQEEHVSFTTHVLSDPGRGNAG